MTTTRTCTIDGRDVHHETGQHACTPCTRRMTGWLTELPNQLVVLRASVMPERVAGQPTTGTRTPPIPGRLDVLSLLGPAAPGDVHDPHGDQHGPLPITATLGTWCRLIAEERRLAGPTGGTEEQLAAWLAAHLDWCATQRWVGELHDELDGMMRAIRGITRVRPGRRPVPAPCPRCSSLALVETDWQLYRECGVCGSLWTAGELAAAAPELLARETAA